MVEATEATNVAIEQNGLENGAAASTTSSSDDESEPEMDTTKGDEDREIDSKKEELLKVIQ